MDQLAMQKIMPPELEAGKEALSAVLAAQRADDAPLALFQALDSGLSRSPGHLLLTVLVFHRTLGESQRAYSSRPIEYPVGARKTLSQAPRMRHVLASGEPFIGRSRQDIIDNYPDYSSLLAMGCESIVNMPVRWGAEVLGTVNLLHAHNHYAEADLARISVWAQLSVPAFLATILRR